MREAIKTILKSTLGHTRNCSYNNYGGDMGDFCTCNKAYYKATDEIIELVANVDEMYDTIKVHSGDASPSSPFGWRKYLAKVLSKRIRGEE